MKINTNMESINSMISRLNTLGDGREKSEKITSEEDLLKMVEWQLIHFILSNDPNGKTTFSELSKYSGFAASIEHINHPSEKPDIIPVTTLLKFVDS